MNIGQDESRFLTSASKASFLETLSSSWRGKLLLIELNKVSLEDKIGKISFGLYSAVSVRSISS